MPLARREVCTVETATAKTNKLDVEHAWEQVRNELKLAGIGADEHTACSQNAERALRGLQLSNLTAHDIACIGMLVQAVVHATGLRSQT